MKPVIDTKNWFSTYLQGFSLVNLESNLISYLTFVVFGSEIIEIFFLFSEDLYFFLLVLTQQEQTASWNAYKFGNRYPGCIQFVQPCCPLDFFYLTKHLQHKFWLFICYTCSLSNDAQIWNPMKSIITMHYHSRKVTVRRCYVL